MLLRTYNSQGQEIGIVFHIFSPKCKCPSKCVSGFLIVSNCYSVTSHKTQSQGICSFTGNCRIKLAECLVKQAYRVFGETSLRNVHSKLLLIKPSLGVGKVNFFHSYYSIALQVPIIILDVPPCFLSITPPYFNNWRRDAVQKC